MEWMDQKKGSGGNEEEIKRMKRMRVRRKYREENYFVTNSRLVMIKGGENMLGMSEN